MFTLYQYGRPSGARCSSHARASGSSETAGAGAITLDGAACAFAALRGAADASSVIQCGTLDGRPRFAMTTRLNASSCVCDRARACVRECVRRRVTRVKTYKYTTGLPRSLILLIFPECAHTSARTADAIRILHTFSRAGVFLVLVLVPLVVVVVVVVVVVLTRGIDD